MEKKKIAAIAVTAALILTAALLFFTLKKDKIEEITVAHSMSGDTGEEINRQLRHYDVISPKKKIIIHNKKQHILLQQIYDGQISPDILIISGPLEKELPFNHALPRLWSGRLWSIALNSSVVDKSIINEFANRDNSLDIEKFTTLLQEIKDSGTTPIAVGNSHLWPLVLWDQHIRAFLNNETAFSPAEVFSRSIKNESQDILRSWYRKGFFLEETMGQGWARGLSAMSSNKAGIAILSGGMISAIPFDKRKDIVFLPFPAGNSPQRWVVGSGINIISNTENNERSALELTEYLTSSSVTEILSEKSGILFLAGDFTSIDSYIPGWENLANNSEMRNYAEKLRSFVIK